MPGIETFIGSKLKGPVQRLLKWQAGLECVDATKKKEDLESHQIVVHDDRMYFRIIYKGAIAFGEAYMDGDWTPATSLMDVLTGAIKAGSLEGKLQAVFKFFQFLSANLGWINPQSIFRSTKVAKMHYDLGNDIYEKMLCSHMQYTCAYWRDVPDAPGAPHVRDVATAALEGAVERRASQAIVISGESGAGKTVSATRIIEYLVASGGLGRSRKRESFERREKAKESLLARLGASIPSLEALGNASTGLNDNSSRFGKLVKLSYDGRGGERDVVGASRGRVRCAVTGYFKAVHTVVAKTPWADCCATSPRGRQHYRR